MKNMIIPSEVKTIVQKFRENNYEAYIVGGCVRDLLRKAKPQDWDIATNANPEEVKEIFPKSYEDNKFGTVTILTNSKDQRLKEIEITTYRIEERYSDKRHPDSIHYAKTIEQDLARRDFTINAIAVTSETSKSKNKKALLRSRKQQQELKVIDLFDGQEDLRNKIIRAVGNPEHRFSEDALRMMRAVRLAATLNFDIEPKTSQAIRKNAFCLRAISKERIRDELMKIIMSGRASEGIESLRKLGLLKYIIPELEQGYGVTQNKHHIYEVYEHNILCLKYATQRNFNKYVRWAALLHDVGKPRTKQGEGQDSTFYNHEILGAKMTAEILSRLKFSKKDQEKIVKLVRYHLFYYNPGEVGEASIRKLVRQVGLENIEELIQVRMCDRIGSGCPKAEPYKLRHLRYVIEKVSHHPISVKMLKIGGNEVMKILEKRQGPVIGDILSILLGQVLSHPATNKKTVLEKEIRRLGKMSGQKIQEIAEKAEKEREKIEIKKDEMAKKKYWVT